VCFLSPVADDWSSAALRRHKRADYLGCIEATRQAPPDSHSQAAAHALRAAALERLGRGEEAFVEVEAALRLGPPSAQLYLLAARICAGRHELAAALDWTDRALQLDPRRRTLELRGSIVQRMRLLSGPHEQLELAVRLEPENLDARRRLIDSLLRLRLYDEAQPHIAVALQRQPDDLELNLNAAVAALEGNAPADAVPLLQGALSLTTDGTRRLWILRALRRAGALELVKRTLHAERCAAPDDPALQLEAAWLELWQGDLARAEATAAALPPQTARLERLHAALAFVGGRPRAALAHAEAAIAADPRDAEAMICGAAALLRLGRHSEAHRLALRAAQSSPDWHPAADLVILGDVAGLRAARRGIRSFPTRRGRTPGGHAWMPAEAHEWFTALDVNPPVGDAEMVPADLLLSALDAALARLSGNFTAAPTFVSAAGNWTAWRPRLPARAACVHAFDAIQARPWARVAERLQALAAVYPTSPYVHTHTAELWLWYGDYPACEAECRKALCLTQGPAARWAWVGLGAALMLQARYDEALEVFAESCRRMEPGPPLLAYRGETFRRCGRYEDASSDLVRTLEGEPRRVSAWLNLGLIAAATGDSDRLLAIERRVRQAMPELLDDVTADTGLGAQADAAARVANLFENVLQAMRGNRSSNRVTYFLSDGRARVLPARPLGDP